MQTGRNYARKTFPENKDCAEWPNPGTIAIPTVAKQEMMKMAEGSGLAIELRLLAYLALLSLMIWVPYILAAMSARGMAQVAGYPTGNYGELPEWAQRCQRVHMNLVENLVPFGALVLVAQVAGASNDATVLGAQLFFWARLAQAAVHIAGVPYLRTGAFAVGWIGCLIIFWQVVTV